MYSVDFLELDLRHYMPRSLRTLVRRKRWICRVSVTVDHEKDEAAVSCVKLTTPSNMDDHTAVEDMQEQLEKVSVSSAHTGSSSQTISAKLSNAGTVPIITSSARGPISFGRINTTSSFNDFDERGTVADFDFEYEDDQGSVCMERTPDEREVASVSGSPSLPVSPALAAVKANQKSIPGNTASSTGPAPRRRSYFSFGGNTSTAAPTSTPAAPRDPG
jgi:hypothetical protein